MRRTSRGAVALLLILLGSLTLAATPAKTRHDAMRIQKVDGLPALANQVIVRYRKGATAGERQAARDLAAAGHVHAIGRPGLRLFCLHSQTKDVATLVQEMREQPGVLYAEPNYLVRTTATPNDSRFGELWGLQNTGQTIKGQAGTPGADISATDAWDVSTGSPSVVVGVVDTGIDFNHPDLAPNVWSAPAAFTVTIGGQSITCPKGSHGFNAVNNTCDPMDDHNHGSHVSGTIGAAGNDGVGVVGVNWTTSIMGLKFLSSSGNGSVSDAIDAVEFAIQAKQAFASTGGANVRVLSNSWGGGGFSQALLDQIKKANDNAMLFTAAAGNNNKNNDSTAFFPANYNAPNVVSVAATDNRDAKSSFSNYGASTVHLGAPGTAILSTVRNGGYSFFNGTSMATPHVSGAAALILSACTLDTAGLKATLLNNVDPTSSLSGITITGGRLNVDRAVRSCAGPFNVTASPSLRSIAPGTTATYTVTVGLNGGFTGTVDLGASGLPAGATASVDPPSVTGGGTASLTITTSSATPLGRSTVTITGTSGTLQDSTTVTLEVANPDFSIAGGPGERTVAPGASTTYTVNLGSVGGFSDAVALSAAGLPAGATASFNPSSVTAPGSSTLSVTTNTTTPEGTSPVTITGTASGITHSTTVTLHVVKPDFSLSVSPSSITVGRGFPALFYHLDVRSLKGFSGTVRSSVSGLPAGAAANGLNPVTISPDSPNAILLVWVPTSRTTPTGSFPLTFTATGGGVTHSATATLVVTP